jgi:hypothetical protein
VVGDWNVNRGGTARTEGRDRSERPGRFMQPEFLPAAGDWRAPRYGLRIQRLVRRILYNPKSNIVESGEFSVFIRIHPITASWPSESDLGPARI